MEVGDQPEGSCSREGERKRTETRSVKEPDSGGIAWAELMALNDRLDYLEHGMGLEGGGGWEG